MNLTLYMQWLIWSVAGILMILMMRRRRLHFAVCFVKQSAAEERGPATSLRYHSTVPVAGYFRHRN